MKTLVLYHASCADGFGAAYAAWSHFGDLKDVTYQPVQYGDLLPKLDAIQDANVYILDFSYTPQEVISMSSFANSITLLDHHKTARDKWAVFLDEEGCYSAGNMHIVFDMTRSGAWMAWDHFYPEVKRPALIEHVGDRDLWLFNHPDTKTFCAGLSAKPNDFKVWAAVANYEDLYHECIKAGEAILNFQQSQIDKASSGELRPVKIAGEVGLANNTTNNISEVGNAIAKRSGTFSLTFFVKDNEAICSLRSIAPYDCSKLAKHYGGGGHAQAAGFKLPLNTFINEVWNVAA